MFPFGADVGRVMNDQDRREYAQTPQPPDLRGTLITNPQPPSFGGFIPLATRAGSREKNFPTPLNIITVWKSLLGRNLYKGCPDQEPLNPFGAKSL